MQDERVQLRSGLVIEAGYGAGELWLAAVDQAGHRDVLRWPSWRGGVGGLELVVSPDERLVALFIYSGQSSQGYELFSLTPLARLSGLREVKGRVMIDVASLYVQPVAPIVGEPQRHALGIELPLSTDLDWFEEWERYDALAFRAGLLELRLPGGKLVTTALPPTEPLTAHP